MSKKRVYFRTTLVDGKPQEPRELFVDGRKIADMTRFEIIELILDATLTLRDADV